VPSGVLTRRPPYPPYLSLTLPLHAPNIPVVTTRPVEPDDRRAVAEIILGWGSDIVVTRGRIHHPIDLPGFVALDDDNKLVGLVTYTISGRECEIVTLDAHVKWQGIGTALLKAVCREAIAASCTRVWLITTNDNIDAIRFYQRRGFVLKAVYANAIAESRKLKPQIPLIGEHGIPIRDEIEFERVL